jgi:glc operon protein GlcG
MIVTVNVQALLVLCVVAAPLAAQAPAPAPSPVRPPYGTPVTLTQAKAIVTGAESEMRKNGWKMAVAIVEPSGDLVAFERLDDTQYGSLQVAQTKARAAAEFRRRTKEFADAVAGGATNVLTLPGAIAVDGGIPIVVDGKCIGAVGVSGGSADQDAQAALAGLATLATLK